MGFSMGYIGLKFKLRGEQGLSRKRQRNSVFQYFGLTGRSQTHRAGSHAHIPADLVVTRRFSHQTLAFATGSPHHVSAAPTAICMEMRHGPDRQSARKNRTITADFHNEATYDQIHDLTKVCPVASPFSSPSAFSFSTRPAAVRVGPDAPLPLRAGSPRRAHHLAHPVHHLQSGLHRIARFVLRYRTMRPEVARDALLATHGGLSLEWCAVIGNISPMALYRLVCALGQQSLVACSRGVDRLCWSISWPMRNTAAVSPSGSGCHACPWARDLASGVQRVQECRSLHGVLWRVSMRGPPAGANVSGAGSRHRRV